MNIVTMEKGCFIGRNTNEQQYGNIIATETLYPKGYNSDWHYHRNPHFSHILQGGSQENYESGSSFSQIQRAGAALYYFPGIAHQNIHYSADTRIFNLEIDQHFFEKYHLTIPSEARMFSKQTLLNTAGLARILREHYYRDRQSELAITQLVILLIEGTAPPTANYPKWATQVRTLLYDSWNSPVSLTELADDLDIHPVTLSKYFTKYFHVTLGEYRRRIKIEKAIHLIRDQKHSLTEIAYICDFSDQAHFTKTFRRITGLLPKQYRTL